MSKNQTKFRQLDPVPDLPKMEKEIIKFWDETKIVERLKKLRREQKAKVKVYYDGPITANNTPHYGHAITWTMKDIVPRYWSMRGYFVSRNMGWDCQGIPVEYEIEKQLGFENKEEIEEYGVEKFNQLCRESVFKYRDAIFYYEKRIGRWFDEEDMYYTMDASYIESMWWSLKELYSKKLLYEGYKVVAYSTRAGTPLSTHEVNDGGYKEVEDPFVTVKFPLKDDPNTSFLAWTTTPWTMPGNLLLAIGKKIKYVKVESDGEYYIVAKDCLESVFKERNYKIVATFQASDLEGKEYIQPFSHYESKRAEGVFKVVISDHANTDEGTGIVHLAPYGAEDFDVFMSMGIEIFDYLNDTAHFTDEIPEYSGLFYKDANSKIIEDLEKSGRLFDSGKYLHRMPMCWRTGTPLIYKPIKSWYIAVTKIKDRMLEENQKINWVPEHIKDGMSKQWLSNARDWALSRSRYWGTPLPLWINDKTNEYVFVGSFAELEKLSGVKVKDPHRPFVDDITWEDEKNGGTFRRVPDVIDVWYDSGSVPFAKLHYPFENKDVFNSLMPAEYISEGADQVRLWFYTMHVLGVALFDKVPYRNVVVTGMLNDKFDKKLSKSKKNYPPMDEVLDTLGGDVMRMFLLTSPVVQAESARFYDEALQDVKKEFFMIFWNSLKYFTTYANLHGFDPDTNNLSEPQSKSIMDQWMIARLQQSINTIVEKMDEYQIMDAARELTPLVNDLSVWYIRRSRERISTGDREALDTLYYVLSTISKVMAPMVPFFAETTYSILNLPRLTDYDSVHLDLYPEVKKLTKEQLVILDKMKQTRDLASRVHSLRAELHLPVKQGLHSLATTVPEDQFYPDVLKAEVNVKNIESFTKQSEFPKQYVVSKSDSGVALDMTITPELEEEAKTRDLIRKIQNERKKMGMDVSEKVRVSTDWIPKKKELLEMLKTKASITTLSEGEFSVTKDA